MTTKTTPRILCIFLLEGTPATLTGNKSDQAAMTEKVIKKYGLDGSSKHLVRNDEDILKINIHDADVFVIFPYTLKRFAPLIYLAETKKTVIIVSEEDIFLNALETYDYLSDHSNAQLVFSPRELRAKIRVAEKAKWLSSIKVCIFDAGQWQLQEIAWQKNPLFQGKINTQNVDAQKFLENCKNMNKTQAELLARRWIKEAKVLEPSSEDVVKTARIYLAMKAMMDEMGANAVYVLWCGQFTKPLEAKMCFALSKLSDEGIPVGCWRGGNLLPMLILHTVSGKPVFTPEVLSYKGKTIALKHCFASAAIAQCKYTLRNWRNTKGTVTGYVQLPIGRVTLINCAVGDRIVVTRGKVVGCKDLEGQNCRITVWVELEHEETIHKFVGREFAMVYGHYDKEAKEVAENLGIRIL